jgi:hypothetical protein
LIVVLTFDAFFYTSALKTEEKTECFSTKWLSPPLFCRKHLVIYGHGLYYAYASYAIGKEYFWQKIVNL